MEFPTISRSGITDDNSRLFPEIPTGVGTLHMALQNFVNIGSSNDLFLEGITVNWFKAGAPRE